MKNRFLTKKGDKMKKIIALIMSVICLAVFAGCSGNSGGSSSALSQTESGDASSEAPKYAKDPLTGEYTLDFSAEDKRPIAIMINNIKVSLPQRGIAEASILYEVLAEGGITRLMAVYPDINKIPDVGSVRSGRHYYYSLANAHKSIFVHYGGSHYLLKYISDNNLKTINFLTNKEGANRIPASPGAYRDNSRKAPHNAFTSGERLKTAISKKGLDASTTINDAYKFGDNSSTLALGNAATTVTVPFSSSYKSQFVYNAESGKYEKKNYVSKQFVDHIDQSTGKALEYTNVFILQTPINLMNANAGYIDVKLTSGSGYYACGGKIIPISWAKNGFDGEMKYYTTDGKELTVKSGKSYVGVAPTTSNVTYAE